MRIDFLPFQRPIHSIILGSLNWHYFPFSASHGYLSLLSSKKEEHHSLRPSRMTVQLKPPCSPCTKSGGEKACKSRPLDRPVNAI